MSHDGSPHLDALRAFAEADPHVSDRIADRIEMNVGGKLISVDWETKPRPRMLGSRRIITDKPAKFRSVLAPNLHVFLGVMYEGWCAQGVEDLARGRTWES